jgi:hypothetical protein
MHTLPARRAFLVRLSHVGLAGLLTGSPSLLAQETRRERRRQRRQGLLDAEDAPTQGTPPPAVQPKVVHSHDYLIARKEEEIRKTELAIGTLNDQIPVLKRMAAGKKATPASRNQYQQALGQLAAHRRRLTQQREELAVLRRKRESSGPAGTK